MAQPSRILLYDIETSPLITYAWQIYEADAIKIIKDTQILCFAYKWLGEKTVKAIGQDDLKGYKPGVNNDKAVVEALWKLFDEADVIIAHNGNSFDQKIVQSRMIVHALRPPRPYKQIDTKNATKRVARFPSNKLDDLGKALSIGQKLETGGFATWEGCLAGDSKAWFKMKKYNKQDVALLEQVYLKIRPWISNHPAVSSERPEACPKCGGGPLHSTGWRKTATRKYCRYQCQACGGYCSDIKADKEREVKYVSV